MKPKRLRKDLNEHKVIGVDTGVFIQHFQGGEDSELTSVVLGEIQGDSVKGIVSSISLTELMVRPLEAGDDDLADLYRVLIHEMPNLETVSVDPRIASRAAEIRATSKMGPTESLLLATAQESGATAFVTSDPGLKQAKGIKVMVLNEYH
ncbi:MAG TPA: PIN domain-containing protein [Candidatus Anoxymicrobiaceae bacterium]|jgi:predicted nucleic acid-binding protein